MSFQNFRQELERLAGRTIYRRGVEYFREGRVERLAIRAVRFRTVPAIRADGKVRGSRLSYRVTLILSEEGELLDASCTCPYFTAREWICKHIVALGLASEETLLQSSSEPNRPSPRTPPSPRPAPVSTQEGEGYVLGLQMLFGQNRLLLIPVRRVEAWREELKRVTPSHKMRISPRKVSEPPPCVNLTPEEARDVFRLFLKQQLLMEIHRFPNLPVWISVPPDPWYSEEVEILYPPMPLWPIPDYRMILDVERGPSRTRILLSLQVGEKLYPEEAVQYLPLDNGYTLLIVEGKRFVLGVRDDLWEALQGEVKEYRKALEESSDAPEVVLHTYIVPHALSEFEGSEDLDLFPSLPIEVVDVEDPPRPRLYLRWDPEKGLVASFRLVYEEEDTRLETSRYAGWGGWEVDEEPIYVVTRTLWRYLRVSRFPKREEAVWMKRLASVETGLKRTRWGLQLRRNVSLETFLAEYVPKIAAMGVEVVGLEDLPVRVVQDTPRVRLWIRSGIQWLDGEIRIGAYRYTLEDFLKLFEKKKSGRMIPLSDGEIGVIPESVQHFLRWIQRVSRMDREVALHLLNQMHSTDDLDVPVDLPEIHPEPHDPEGLDHPPLPETFQGVLRPYQVAGYQWLHALHARRLGGILADDMGLGKTVQVIAFLLRLRERKHADSPDLVVVPRSLLFNWEEEIRRFAPSLRVGVYHGPRRPPLDRLMDRDVLLTTYDMLRQDIQVFCKHRFHYVILDEAQMVKNPLTKTARSLRRVPAEHRLCLTGTPVENSPLDLWALVDFVLPGYLGTFREFKAQFALPVLRGDQEATKTLRRLVHPLILRRTKEQVARELPPRVEEVVWCTMTPEQETVYHETRSRLYVRLKKRGHPLEILRALTLLRQMALHPGLVLEGYAGDSGKMEVLISMLEMLAAEGRKTLVYSQFVKFLEMVEKELEKRSIPYVSLTGKTRNRKQRVKQFQEDPDLRVFLLSLKAGGVGLNLTAADTVILADPWWNPQVERQAVDRAHRIGQDKTVFVSRLVTRGTVEEKIRFLQERKQALADALIQEDARGMKQVDWEEVVEMLFTRFREKAGVG